MTQIRTICSADRDAILQLLESTAAFQAHELAVALELVDIVLTKPGQQDYLAFVAEQDGLIVAYACFGRNPMTRFTYDLYWLATRRERMRQGHGRSMVRFVEEEVQRLGGRLLVIETSSKDSYAGSREFYVGTGFQQAGVVPNFYDLGDDRVIYYKPL